MDLTGTSTVVTGGASGLGLATAHALHDRGATVTIVDLDSTLGEAAATAVGDRARFVAADITEAESMGRAFDVAQASGPIRAIVHCAGRGGDRVRILSKDGVPVIRTNLVGTYNVLRLGAQRMAANADLNEGDRGAIVLTASVAAFEGQIGQTSYAAAKAGVHGLTIVAARDLASWAIRVNTIAPGIFETPMLGRLREDIRTGLAEAVPHPRRLGQASEYGRLAIELLENGYLNGQTIRLDGAIRMAPR
jgi:NAD(P)-dependent dehydrogenase (short-subunit alcohol dehydrogenase family)